MSRFSVDRSGFSSVDENVQCTCMEEIHLVESIQWCIVGRQLVAEVEESIRV